jgi:acyl carrier protein
MNEKRITNIIVSKLNKIKKIEKKYFKDIDNFNFISSGHADSIEILKFNFEIENKFKISIKPSETILKNFGTVKGLRSIILKRMSKVSK